MCSDLPTSNFSEKTTGISDLLATLVSQCRADLNKKTVNQKREPPTTPRLKLLTCQSRVSDPIVISEPALKAFVSQPKLSG